jgi:hypothetical protein
VKVNAVFGAGVAGKSYVVTRQRRLNCYYENRDDKDKSPIAVYGTPGLKLKFALPGTSPARGLLGSRVSLFAVAGSTFYKLSGAGSTLYSAAYPGSLGLVSMSQNNTQVVVVNGVAGYIFAGGVLQPISAAGFPQNATTVTCASGFFVVEVPGTQQFQVSGLFDGTTWNPLSFASASQYPDVLLAVDTLIGNLVLFSSTHLEFWQNVGATPQPFQPILSATVEYGLAAVFSRVHVDSSLIFLAQSQQGGIKVCQIKGYAVQPISTPDLEYIFGTFSTVADAVALAYDADKHPMYQLTFPTANRSFLYDCSTGMWSETQTGLTPAYAKRHIGNLATTVGTTAVLSDYANANLYVPDPLTFTDNGQTIKRQIITRHQLADLNTFSIDEVYVDMETGVGLSSGQGSNPVLGLKCSKDNGRTWLTERTKAIGQMGQYNANGIRAHWNRWGSSRVFTFDLCMTDPVKFALTAGASATHMRPQT